jgi:hypothetical protein
MIACRISPVGTSIVGTNDHGDKSTGLPTLGYSRCRGG